MKSIFLLAAFLATALALPQTTNSNGQHDPLHPAVPIAPGSGGVRFSPTQNQNNNNGQQSKHDPLHSAVPIAPGSGGVRLSPDNPNLRNSAPPYPQTIGGVPINPASGGVQLSPDQAQALHDQNCISQSEAQTFVERFIGIVTHKGSDLGTAEQTAEAVIAEGFNEVSDSILSLEGKSLNSDGRTASSKEEWVNGVLHAPPFGGVETNKIFVGGGEFCDQVVWYWKFTDIGSGQYPIKGFNLFTVERTGKDGLIQVKKLELEFDSISWGKDTGFAIQAPQGKGQGSGQQGQSSMGQ